MQEPMPGESTLTLLEDADAVLITEYGVLKVKDGVSLQLAAVLLDSLRKKYEKERAQEEGVSGEG